MMVVYYDTILDPGRIKTNLWMQQSFDRGVIVDRAGESDDGRDGRDVGGRDEQLPVRRLHRPHRFRRQLLSVLDGSAERRRRRDLGRATHHERHQFHHREEHVRQGRSHGRRPVRAGVLAGGVGFLERPAGPDERRCAESSAQSRARHHGDRRSVAQYRTHGGAARHDRRQPADDQPVRAAAHHPDRSDAGAGPADISLSVHGRVQLGGRVQRAAARRVRGADAQRVAHGRTDHTHGVGGHRAGRRREPVLRERQSCGPGAIPDTG